MRNRNEKPKQTRKSTRERIMKHFIPMIFILAVAACSASEPGQVASSEEGAVVVVSRAAAFPGFDSYPATLVPVERAGLATRMSGTIRRILVDVGSEVSSGQVLAELDASDIEARIAAAEANRAWLGALSIGSRVWRPTAPLPSRSWTRSPPAWRRRRQG
jgi:multidrug efflux pump subunit AcrA (membrane-fusion protein)